VKSGNAHLIILILLLSGSGCQRAHRSADIVAGNDIFYWLALTACGLAMYRVLRIIGGRGKTSSKSWSVTILFALAMAWRAFGSARPDGKEWLELAILGALWLGIPLATVLVRKILSAVSKMRSSRPAEKPKAAQTRSDSPPRQPAPAAKPPKIPAAEPAPLADASQVSNVIPFRPATIPKASSAMSTAIRFLRNQKIGAGRELLVDLCKDKPQDMDNLVLAALEFIRPPEDRKKSWDYLKQADKTSPGSGDAAALWVLATYSNGDYKALWERYRRIGELPVRSSFGYFFSLWSSLCASDLLFQCSFRPEGSAIDKVFTNSALIGAAQLMLRQHDRARETFSRGRQQAPQFPGRFEESFKVELNQQDRENLASLLKIYCTIGQGLVLYDTGQVDGCRAIIRELTDEGQAGEGLQSRLTGFLAETEKWPG
jgi:hypothetical protein